MFRNKIIHSFILSYISYILFGSVVTLILNLVVSNFTDKMSSELKNHKKQHKFDLQFKYKLNNTFYNFKI